MKIRILSISLLCFQANAHVDLYDSHNKKERWVIQKNLNGAYTKSGNYSLQLTVEDGNSLISANIGLNDCSSDGSTRTVIYEIEGKYEKGIATCKKIKNPFGDGYFYSESLLLNANSMPYFSEKSYVTINGTTFSAKGFNDAHIDLFLRDQLKSGQYQYRDLTGLKVSIK
ncbi:hypothetical protein ACS3CU_001807 [Vibrio parahaemolyticus]